MASGQNYSLSATAAGPEAAPDTHVLPPLLPVLDSPPPQLTPLLVQGCPRLFSNCSGALAAMTFTVHDCCTRLLTVKNEQGNTKRQPDGSLTYQNWSPPHPPCVRAVLPFPARGSGSMTSAPLLVCWSFGTRHLDDQEADVG